MLFVAPLRLCAQKFAHFDYNAILSAMPEAKTAQTELETIYKKYQSDMENMQKELQTKAEKYQKEDTDKTASQQAGIFINESASNDATSAIMKKLGISATATTPAKK